MSELAQTSLKSIVVEDLINSGIPFPGEGKRESSSERRSNKAFLSLTDLYEMKLEPSEAVVEGLLYRENISIITAKPKVGKSTIMRFLSKCLADGEEFLGRKVKEGKVLYLVLEEPLPNVVNDFRTMAVKNTGNILISQLKGGLDKQIQIENLVAEIKPNLVVVDTLIHATRIRDINDYFQVTSELRNFRSIAELHNCHIVLVHHAKKGENLGIDSVLGSSALAAAADSILHLSEGSEKVRRFSSNGRVGDFFDETNLQFDKSNKHFSIHLNQNSSVEDEINKLIAACPGISREQVRDSLGKRSQAISDGLRALENLGAIRRDKDSQGKDKFFAMEIKDGGICHE